MKLKTNKKIQTYRLRYNQYYLEVIDEVIARFSGTRKCGKISPTVLMREYEYWNKYPVKKVIAALKIYLNKQCYVDNKNERYIRGIIRNITDEQVDDVELFTTEQLVTILKDLKKKIIDSCSECGGSGYELGGLDTDTPVARTCRCIIKFKKERDKLIKVKNGDL